MSKAKFPAPTPPDRMIEIMTTAAPGDVVLVRVRGQRIPTAYTVLERDGRAAPMLRVRGQRGAERLITVGSKRLVISSTGDGRRSRRVVTIEIQRVAAERPADTRRVVERVRVEVADAGRYAAWHATSGAVCEISPHPDAGFVTVTIRESDPVAIDEEWLLVPTASETKRQYSIERTLLDGFRMVCEAPGKDRHLGSETRSFSVAVIDAWIHEFARARAELIAGLRSALGLPGYKPTDFQGPLGEREHLAWLVEQVGLRRCEAEDARESARKLADIHERVQQDLATTREQLGQARDALAQVEALIDGREWNEALQGEPVEVVAKVGRALYREVLRGRSAAAEAAQTRIPKRSAPLASASPVVTR